MMIQYLDFSTLAKTFPSYLMENRLSVAFPQTRTAPILTWNITTGLIIPFKTWDKDLL